jgi:hypothetical protein
MPSRTNSGNFSRPGSVSGATVNSAALPDIARPTQVATAQAASAATAIRASKRLTNTSKTNKAPAIGALKATANPAPAPAASSARQSSWTRASPGEPAARIDRIAQGTSSISPGRQVLLNHGSSGP